jgi:hypothetical protein
VLPISWRHALLPCIIHDVSKVHASQRQGPSSARFPVGHMYDAHWNRGILLGHTSEVILPPLNPVCIMCSRVQLPPSLDTYTISKLCKMYTGPTTPSLDAYAIDGLCKTYMGQTTPSLGACTLHWNVSYVW